MAEQLALCPDCLEFTCECLSLDLEELLTLDGPALIEWQERMGSIVRRMCYNDKEEPDGLNGAGYWEAGDYG